jgi:hypothetical protein
MAIRPIFAWYDLWVGAFWDASKRRLYILPLPCIGVVIDFAVAGAVTAIESAHWTEGGTGLTNFDPNHAPIYLAAIRKHGDRNLKVSSRPMVGRAIPTDYSLHYLGDRPDLSQFWRVFRAERATGGHR